MTFDAVKLFQRSRQNMVVGMSAYEWTETAQGWHSDVEGVGRLYVRKSGPQQFEGYVCGRRYCVVQTVDLAKAACEHKAAALLVDSMAMIGRR